MAPLDTRGAFYDGTPISSPGELTQVLLKRPILLVRNFTERLLSFGIGRPIEYFDQPTIRAIAVGGGGERLQDLLAHPRGREERCVQMRKTQTVTN